ncbi:hypothetical protein C2R75_01160 [Helicobacter pylori]|uniref:hypothetical protein n=1 Tax=Helicobacter pylori TaxID=210 RepID=UPI000D3B5783|nr:hypothetical protein [Helicobacter pylori]PUD42566.1 hypothetical protein C2R75_01160 [Helicobacter pylori]
MNNAELFWERFEAIAWVINENSDMVDYIDLYSPYDYIIAEDYYLYLSTPEQFKKNHTALSRWYKEYCDKKDEDIVYDFFCVAFDKTKLNYALEVGSDEAILDFLKDAYHKAKVSFTDKSLKEGLEAIMECTSYKYPKISFCFSLL